MLSLMSAACTCEGESHPGPVRPDGSYVGRSAPEIDIIEAIVGEDLVGHVGLVHPFFLQLVELLLFRSPCRRNGPLSTMVTTYSMKLTELSAA